MTVKVSDVLQQEAVRARFEEITQEDLQWRRAFRDLDATGIDNDVMKVPKPEDTMGEPQAIAPGSEFPRDEEDYKKINIDFTKYGFEVALEREAEQDSMLDIAADQVDRQARQMSEFLNRVAYEELSANLNSSSPAGGTGTTGTFEFSDVVDGSTTLKDQGYNPRYVIVSPQAEADLLTSDDFLRATDLGDDTLTEGRIGRVAGLDVYSTNAGHLTGSSGIIVDPDYYGYEAVREPVMTDEYSDPERQVDVMQIWTRRGFKAIDPSAAIQVDG